LLPTGKKIYISPCSLKQTVERQSGWESSDNQDENLVSRQWNDGRCSLVWSSTLQHRKQGL